MRFDEKESSENINTKVSVPPLLVLLGVTGALVLAKDAFLSYLTHTDGYWIPMLRSAVRWYLSLLVGGW